MFKEAEICKVVVDKLKSEGCHKVVCEVPLFYRRADAAALMGEDVIILEAKVSLNVSLCRQLQSDILAADEVIAVIAKRPNSINPHRKWCEFHGVGIYLVTDENVEVILAPKKQNPNIYEKEKLKEKIKTLDEDTVGGLPNLRGVGVAQDVQRRVDEYLAINTKATWKEIFKNVPSHYKTHQNMYSALRSNAIRLEWRASQKLTESKP